MLLPIVLAVHVRTLDLRFDAVPVAEVVAEIAKSSGQALTVDSDVGKEIVALRLPGVTPEQAMDILGEGLDATWIEASSGKRLVRTSDQLANERNSYEKIRREAFRRGLERIEPVGRFDANQFIHAANLLDRIQANDEFSSDQGLSIRQAAEMILDQNVYSRFVRAFARQTSLSDFLALSNGQATYHTAPNSQQLSLTVPMRQALPQLRNEIDVLRAQGCTLFGQEFPSLS